RSLPIQLSVSSDAPIAGYYLSEDPRLPAATTPGWSSTLPGSFRLSDGDGRKTVFAWARDVTGKLSPRAWAPTVLDTRPPAVRLFAPRVATHVETSVRLKGSDANGIAGYYLSESESSPGGGAGGWLAAPPTRFSLSGGDGPKTIYAWVKDRA